MSERLYIAYGSNLNLKQMEQRCPTAEVVGAAILRNWRLLFRGRHMGAVATVERQKCGIVPVLVWALQPEDEQSLDCYEGWPHLYRKETVRITLNGKRAYAMIYIMNDGHPYGLPSRYYFNTIRRGYESAGFDLNILQSAVNESQTMGGEHHMSPTVREQILAIRDTSKTNMLDANAVMNIAMREGYYELVDYIFDHKREYGRFIMTGKTGEEEPK